MKISTLNLPKYVQFLFLSFFAEILLVNYLRKYASTAKNFQLQRILNFLIFAFLQLVITLRPEATRFRLLSSKGVGTGAWGPDFCRSFTLSQQRSQIIPTTLMLSAGPYGFSDLPTALSSNFKGSCITFPFSQKLLE